VLGRAGRSINRMGYTFDLAYLEAEIGKLGLRACAVAWEDDRKGARLTVAAGAAGDGAARGAAQGTDPCPALLHAAGRPCCWWSVFRQSAGQGGCRELWSGWPLQRE